MGVLYFYRVCPFGATLAAYWWQRLGAWILRFFHHAVWISHAAWLYVDDYLWLQDRQILPLATFLAMVCQTLGIPISWRQTQLASSIHWIGWTFHFVAGYIDIPQDKLDKLMRYIEQLSQHSRPPRSYLEKTIGLLMWITQLFHIYAFAFGAYTMICMLFPAASILAIGLLSTIV